LEASEIANNFRGPVDNVYEFLFNYLTLQKAKNVHHSTWQDSQRTGLKFNYGEHTSNGFYRKIEPGLYDIRDVGGGRHTPDHLVGMARALNIPSSFYIGGTGSPRVDHMSYFPTGPYFIEGDFVNNRILNKCPAYLGIWILPTTHTKFPGWYQSVRTTVTSCATIQDPLTITGVELSTLLGD